jgi:putative tricarboxylic transport membrane protein
MARGWSADRVGGVALLALGLFVTWQSRMLPLGSLRNPGPGLLPLVLASLVAVSGALLVVFGRRSPSIGAVGWGQWPHAVTIMVACGAATFALERLGYRLTMTFLLLVLLRGVERRSTALAVVLALGLSFASFFLFHTVLRVPLPRGPLGI